MKRVFFFVFFVAISFSIYSQEAMTIKTIDPSPMVAPSKNEQAAGAYNQGTQFLDDNKLDEAEKYLKEAIALDPLFVDAMDHLGRVYRMQNRLREAEEIYLKSIEINSENSVPYQNLAVVYRMQNRLNDAFELYKKMIEIDADNPESYYGMGEIFYVVSDYEKAMPYFDKAIELYKNLNSSLIFDGYYYKGMIYFKTNEYVEALKYLEAAQRNYPNDAAIEKTINEMKNKNAGFSGTTIEGVVGKTNTLNDLTQRQLWALALTGIMTEINKDSHLTLNFDTINEENKYIYLEVLRRDWGINNKTELLETLETMENDGHAARLRYIKKIINESNNDYSALFEKYELDETAFNRLKFTIANWELYKDRNILSWDLGRNIALCRWGYDVGFLTENEAWDKVMYFARKIQPLYNSWDEYGFDYYLGRVFWASGFGAAEKYVSETEPIYKKLVGESGYWHTLKWNINLGQ